MVRPQVPNMVRGVNGHVSVRGVGDYWDWLKPFLPGAMGASAGWNVGQATIDNTGVAPGQPRPTFGSALGTEVGKGVRTLIFIGLAAGLVWYLAGSKLKRFI